MTGMFDVRVDDLRHYDKEAEVYERQPIEKGLIMFYGSSGFTRWSEKWHRRPLEQDIRRKDGSVAAVNHGIGGSTAEEALYYYDRLVRPWAPRALVLREFPNDRHKGYSPAEIMFFYSRIFAWARADFPGIKLYACDVTPTLLNRGDPCWLSHVRQFNSLLRDYCDSHEDTTYVCHTAFPGFYNDPSDVGDYFKVRDDLYIEDKVHFTQEGYDVYRDMFLQVLDDIL